MEILHQTLKQMPRYFSSNEFSKKAQKKGLSINSIHNGIIVNYLTINADRGESKRMWYKRNIEPIQNIEHTQKEIFYDKEAEIKKAILLLKANGYKVMKQTVDYIEV
jgi:hypothetical protein